MSITLQCSLKTADFLDMPFILDNNVYKSFCKENKLIYINKHSNLEKQISETSSNKDIFDESINLYKGALKESGFCETFNYITHTTNKEQRNRKQNIIWFNPPFLRNVKTNIGRTFLCLLSKYFPQNHTMHKIFNRNIIEIS